jgi:hypothetical protein
MKQTAVEWFEAQVGHNSLMGLKEFNEIFEKAKEMEKEQIIKAVYYCLESVKISDDKTMFTATTAEQYYHETYKQQ